MRNTLAIFTCAFLLLSNIQLSAASRATENYFTNPGYENGISPWVAHGEAMLSLSNISHGGKQSCLVSTTGWGGASYDLKNIFDENGDGFYSFYGYVCAESFDAAVYMYLFITYEDGQTDDHWINGSNNTQAPNIYTDSWRLISGSIDLQLKGEIKSASVMFVNNDDKSFFLDDVSISKSENPAENNQDYDVDEQDELKRLTGLISEAGSTTLPAISSTDMSKLMGFNLTNFNNFNEPYGSANNYLPQYTEFKMISELGFNFVRIPFDYAFFVDNFEDKNFIPEKLQLLDQIILYGRKYNIHVMLNMHTAPGYSLARKQEEGDRLWTDEKEQDAFVRQWEALAQRYKGIPNNELSFNLLNEPNSSLYEALALRTIQAIRAVDPERLIVSDNINYQQSPINSLIEYNIVASGRGYYPAFISHYKASWIDDSFNFPDPEWPAIVIPGRLYSPTRANEGLDGPLNISFEKPLTEDYRLGVKIRQVSDAINFVVKADGNTVLEKNILCTGDAGEWTQVIYNDQYNLYANIFDQYFYADIPAGAQKISLEATSGDWMSFYEIAIDPVKQGQGLSYFIPALVSSWGEKATDIEFSSSGIISTDKKYVYDKQKLVEYYSEGVKYNTLGGEVFIGEMGVYNSTPHDVALDYIETLLEIYSDNHWGWAVWNFRGAFGILDSDRTDTEYVTFYGHQLDIDMYNILKSYINVDDDSKNDTKSVVLIVSGVFLIGIITLILIHKGKNYRREIYGK